MRIISSHCKHNKLFSSLRTQERFNIYRLKYQEKVLLREKLHKEKVSLKLMHETTGISRATYYRHKHILNNLDKGIAPPSKRPRTVRKPRWGYNEKQWVYRLRKENPTYGKQKIAVILKRDYGIHMSDSTVGRILAYLKEQGKIERSLSAFRITKKRRFKGHAQSWSYKDYKSMELGERVQIDHMTVTKNGICFKHFQAWDRLSKHMVAEVYTKATSASAKRFLMDCVRNVPYKILSIQVDGGSEFMADFEEGCAELKIPL